MRRLVFPAAVLLLAACGQKTDLEPLAGHSLPPAPLGAKAQPDSEKLLELDPLAAPPRSVELRKRSEERQDDPFDLPPE
ncbi:hypothetical protein GCM10011515_17210 [Tsuneonella deserti]|uniref:Argininosuccinate lyase n=1 Tax=Tsuneonella deserti TaxID=2035528 RepID=A0ABQ1S896_9SPHN|nr:lipoprotein [Tsuneonella deserti]GGD98007.1 hypothetical protein GCM10011515_17210 [Tsuneonella deserti]